MKNNEEIRRFIHEFGFAVIVSDNLEATHIPLLLKADEGEHGVLYGHFAKANRHWKDLEGQTLLAIFNGPHAYISPTWYANGPAVPTWNYAAVHCYGNATLLDETATLHLVSDLVAQYEPDLNSNLTLMPCDYQAKLNKAIVGFKIVITNIQAKEKLGQQRKHADQLGVYQALLASNREDARMLAHYMSQRNLGKGSE